MAIKSGRGPKTVIGKQKVSKNALKHGATSNRFISESERVRYEQLILELREHYQSNNPLINLQLERIARITIQLERIQSAIDATFLISRAQSSTYETLMKSLKMNPREESLAASTFLGIHKELLLDSLDQEKLDVSLDLIKSLVPFPHSTEEFLKRCPILCRHLYNQAREKSLTVAEFIDQELPKVSIASEKIKEQIRIIIWSSKEKSLLDREYEEEILATDYSKLKDAATWYVGELQRASSTVQKIIDFRELLPAQEQATMPNLEELDKLMRYQTTLQRQLSTAIGELLVLYK